MEVAKSIDIKSLDQKSESLTDKLEDIEDKLGNIDDKISVARNLRKVFLKINGLKRSDDDSKLKQDYDKIIDSYNKFKSKIEYLEATALLIKDLGALRTKDGSMLQDKYLDGGTIEKILALYRGSKEALEKIYEEFKGMLEMILSPEEIRELMKVLGSLAIDNPEKFLTIL